jgi:choice-of-anchor B domain-containing protein
MHNYVRSLLLAAFTLCLHLLSFAQNNNVQLRSSITFPGQTLANVCGWTSPDGREYALVGGSKGMIIVDITNPDLPVQIVQIPGPDNLWKEIKTYSHYAYVTSEGGAGVQIIDLSGLPSPNLMYHSYFGTGAAAGNINTIHALHIDVTKGVLYTYGSQGQFNGGVAHDLTADPYNPTYLGKFDQLGYIHDGYAENDTLYGCHIYSGLLSIVDMSDKQNPVLLGSIQTPGKFTHNSWLLDDHKYIVTTDETTPSFLTSYDISDPTDIKELDRFSIDNGFGSIGHNAHIINNFSVTSWYTGGVVITDCSRPSNLVEVGNYDTWQGAGANFDGCWGAYPFFPSGTMIASNISPGQLFILTPTYKRASFLEGSVKNGCNGLPMADAKVEIIGGPASSTTTSSNNGEAKTGMAQEGEYTVQISKAGFVTQTFTANFVSGEVVPFDVTLQPESVYDVTGSVLDGANNTPIANVPVTLTNPNQSYQTLTAADGSFDLSCVASGTYLVSAGLWGYISATQFITVSAGQPVTLTLQKGYYDDFNLDYGWSTDATASAGLWERGEPIGTDFNGSPSNTDNDVPSDAGDQCFVTGNGGGAAGADDVDNGTVTLSSPAMQLAGALNATLDVQYWFFNSGGSGNPNDYFEIRVSNATQNVQILSTSNSASAWVPVEGIKLGDFITLDDQVRIHFITEDVSPGHLVEAAIDEFLVTPILTSATISPELEYQLLISPNPSRSTFVLSYQWPVEANLQLEVINMMGQRIEQQNLSAREGNLQIGHNWAPGFYTARLMDEKGNRQSIKLIKQ